MSTPTPDPETDPVHPAQRILAFLIAGLVIVALGCFAASIIAFFAGALEGEPSGVWITVTMIPWFALPAAMLLTLVLLFVTNLRRARENRR